jgi:hypothetical protein
MKLKINRKIILAIFGFILIVSIIVNPLIQPLNLVVQSSQIVASNPNINGLSFQGSCLVNYDVKEIQATNTTSNLLVNAFQVNTTVFNFSTLILLFTPLVLYMFFEFNKTKSINNTKSIKVTKKRSIKT